MNGKPCILLLAALVYLTETVLLPSAIATGPENKSPCAAKMKGNARPCHREDPAAQCCHRAATCKNPAGNPGNPLQKPGGQRGNCDPRDCNNAANCINCPLCFSATLVTIPDSGTPALLYKMDYPAIPAEPLSAYYSKAWKPPDPCRFSADRI